MLVSRYAGDIITTIRNALAIPKMYTGWRGRTQQEEALATACSPANMARLLAHIDAQDAFLIAKTEELATVAGEQRGRAEKAERERDEALAGLWRVLPNTYTVQCGLNNFASPDPFEGPGETYSNAYRRISTEVARLREVLTAFDRAGFRIAGEALADTAPDSVETAMDTRETLWVVSKIGGRRL